MGENREEHSEKWVILNCYLTRACFPPEVALRELELVRRNRCDALVSRSLKQDLGLVTSGAIIQ